jgi:hypothetical protein
MNLEKELNKLEIDDGDVIEAKATTAQQMNAIQDNLRDVAERLDKDFSMIMIPEEVDISTLNEKQMERLGWFRKEEIKENTVEENENKDEE